MTSLLTRKMMREWKTLSCSNSAEVPLYYLKPQDSNICIWHLLLIEPRSSMEIYIQLYITDGKRSEKESYDQPTVIIRCLTPNNLLPLNRNVSLSHLSHIIMDEGTNTFIMNLWHTFFTTTYTSDSKFHTKVINASTSHIWNRIMCRSFKLHFPELVGSLQTGDYRTVKAYSKWLRTVYPSHCGIFNNNNNNNNSINVEIFQNLIFQHSIDNNKNNRLNNNNLQSLTPTCINSIVSHQSGLCDAYNMTHSYPFNQQRISVFDKRTEDIDMFDFDEEYYDDNNNNSNSLKFTRISDEKPYNSYKKRKF
ncbi:similar to Saccharomyces cerevisiae YBR165W UBS1 Ubiquitin-conjugating enzyme suppressor that functions as a general positive regulator of Cdc34p activity [Maudiozyma saulgeensis]|uniref:Similar to Saccharomyces cerevisiae YBR165W UBS1 Ubiquitin-conjugating enzyme suppressor that functions as a general positive regulator of Cdc34p activity n=1 Tax=Maudiozyma saulgeensis TaxID=1789683 RepID=A0A1X7R223_9SACH|nr:similar to Saccharomyces cerevisiae YBR165W UBS1 Ubiquitin-conjugating enzyme suppressor that functions as a general positive regulator of Cdc34p activity [Kazachstania saulgeensis]